MVSEDLKYCSNPNCYFHTHAFAASSDLSACPACGTTLPINTCEDWLERLYSDKDCWVSDIDHWPSVLAYEYKQLKRFAQRKQPYGLMLCIKDNFETLLKLETLITYAWADLNTTEEFRKSTICLITLSNPSLGRWLELAGLIIRNSKEQEMQIPKEVPLEKLEKIYRKTNLVNWRNEKIGHGALELEDDSEFRESIRNMLILLKNTLEDISDCLNRQKFYSGKTLLEGPQMARNLSCSDKIRCILGNIELDVDPYIVIRKHQKRGYGIYFFDNQRTRTLTSFQAYAEGSWAKETNQYFAQLRKVLESRGIDTAATPDDPYLTEAENRELELVQMTHGFVKPIHLLNWVRECLRKHSKGIFHIEMERGTGKSVFADKLNCLYANPLFVEDNLDVRTYHFSRSQTAGIEDVRSRIQWLWANQYEGGTWQRVPQISDYEHNGLSFSSAIALFLEQARNYAERAREKSKIMMVLDGLDEITDPELWQMIPDQDQLSNGVYILLTSRNPEKEELPSEAEVHLKEIKPTERLIVDRENDDNKAFLLEYIERSGNKSVTSLTDEQKKSLLLLADNRVLQLCLLCKLLDCDIPFDHLPDAERILPAYLELLEQCYGERECIRIREILATLCTLGSLEPLSLAEIGVLTAENHITIKLIGMIRDLAPLLRVVRSNGGNRYSIVNPSLAKELMSQLPETESTIRDIVDLVFDQFSHGWPLECHEMITPSTNVISLALLMKEAVYDVMPQEYGDIFVDFLKGIEVNTLDANGRKLYVKYINQVFAAPQNDSDNAEKTKGRYNNLELLALIYIWDGQYRKALQLYQQVLDYRTQHPEANRELEILKTREQLASAYSILSLHEECENETAIILNKYEEIYGKESIKTLEPRLRMIRCKMHKGNSIVLLQEAESILDLCRKHFPPDHSITLSAVNLVSQLLADLGRYEESILLRKEEIYYQEKKEGSSSRSLILPKKGLADELTKAKRYDEAYEIYQQIIPIAERNLGEDHPVFLDIMNSYAILLSAVGRNHEACEVQRRLVKDVERRYGSHNYETYIAKSNLAATLSHLGEFKEAFETYYSILPDMRRMYGSEHKRFLETQKYFARVVIGLKKYKEAIGILEQYIIGASKIGEPEYEIMAASLEQAFCRAHLGDPNEDLAKMKECADRIKKLCGVDSVITLENQERIVDLLEELHGYKEIINMLQPMIQSVEIKYGLDHPLSIKLRKKLVNTYFSIGEKDKAERLQSEVVASENGIRFRNDENKIKSLRSQVLSLLKSNRVEEALPLSREAYELAKTYYQNDIEEVLSYGNPFSTLLKSLMRLEEAIRIDLELLTLTEKCYGADSEKALEKAISVARDYKGINKEKDALDLIDRIIATCERKNNSDSRLFCAALGEKAAVYKKLGRINESMQINRELAEIYARKEGEGSHNRIAAMNDLGNALYDLGRHEEALKIRKEIFDLVVSQKGLKPEMMVMAYYNLGNSLYSLGNYTEALKNLKQALDYCLDDRRKGVEPIKAKIKIDLARAYEALGLHEDAEKVLDDKL